MIARACTLAVTVFAVMAGPVSAQSPDPISGFVVDLRGAIVGLPTDPGWAPAVPAPAEAPTRGLGIDVGGHVYVLAIGGARLGLGASYLDARSTATPPEPRGDGPRPAVVLPSVTTRHRALVPQVSLNFGHRLGWSYVSAGVGAARVESEAGIADERPDVVVGGEWGRAINVGGGARWFVRRRFGVGFDVRWHFLAERAGVAGQPNAPRATQLVAGAGISIR